MHPLDRTCSFVEICNPNLRSAFFRRDEGEALAIGRPTRTVGVLIGDNFTLLTSSSWNDPDVWRLGVSSEFHIHDAEDDPFAVGRDFGLADALELHHVFKGERTFFFGLVLSDYWHQEQESKKNSI